MKKLLLLCVILSLATFNSLAANGDKFSLEQVMSAPFPTGLVASPVGGKVAWIQSAKGVRNLWVAEPPSYKGRQLTAYTEDDGIEIGELTWTPDGSSVIYTRGGDLDSFAENTNPRSNPEEPKQGIWLIALSGGAPRQLAEGHSAVISKTGDRIFFVKGREVWQAKVDANEKASVLIQPKGRVSFMALSPDGSLLAFTNTRGDHGFVGVYDITAKQLRYLDPSVDRDSEPAWSPDSKQVAFIRVPASREAFIFGPKRSAADPCAWKILTDNSTTSNLTKSFVLVTRSRTFNFLVSQQDNPFVSGSTCHLLTIKILKQRNRIFTRHSSEILERRHVNQTFRFVSRSIIK